MLSDEVFYYLCLLRINGLGGSRVMDLVKNNGSAGNAWENLQLSSNIKDEIANGVIREIEKAGSLGFWLSCPGSSTFPLNLAYFPQVAPVIYGKGEFHIVDEQSLAVVGTRRLSDYGKEVTEFFVQGLIMAKVTIVSGLMRGIDTIAHRAALKFGGRTIAVLGSGINVIVPLENGDLYHEIARSGAVVSQFSLDTQPTKFTFPIRDELIAALSRAILVIEAPEKSGALITAKFALDQGKEVYVIPGEIFSQQSVGCHELIKSGARLVTKPEEILEDLGLSLSVISKSLVDLDNTDLTSEEKTILLLLSEGVKETNDLIRRAGLAANIVSSTLAMLEIKGLLKQMGAGEYRLL